MEDTVPKEDKAQALVTIMKTREELAATQKQVGTLNARVGVLEADHRKLANQLKYNVWTVGQLALGHRKEVEERRRRDTDTKKQLDDLQKIIQWTIYTVFGLLITTILAAILKFTFGL